MIVRFIFVLAALLAVVGAGSCSPAAEVASTTIEIVPDVPPLLVIGIDGATFDRILPLSENGRLPNLSSLMERGAWGPLETLDNASQLDPEQLARLAALGYVDVGNRPSQVSLADPKQMMPVWNRIRHADYLCNQNRCDEAIVEIETVLSELEDCHGH